MLIPPPSRPYKFKSTVVEPFNVDDLQLTYAAAASSRDVVPISAHPSLVSAVEFANKPVKSTASWLSMVSEVTNTKQLKLRHTQGFKGLVNHGLFTLVPLSDKNAYRI